MSSSKMTILRTRVWLMPLLIGIHEGNKDQLLWHALTATKTVNRAKILFMQYFARLRIAVGLLELNECLRDVFILKKCSHRNIYFFLNDFFHSLFVLVYALENFVIHCLHLFSSKKNTTSSATIAASNLFKKHLNDEMPWNLHVLAKSGARHRNAKVNSNKPTLDSLLFHNPRLQWWTFIFKCPDNLYNSMTAPPSKLHFFLKLTFFILSSKPCEFSKLLCFYCRQQKTFHTLVQRSVTKLLIWNQVSEETGVSMVIGSARRCQRLPKTYKWVDAALQKELEKC